jgi:hypothetical protein
METFLEKFKHESLTEDEIAAIFRLAKAIDDNNIPTVKGLSTKLDNSLPRYVVNMYVARVRDYRKTLN